jgi:hypothetical protein
MNKTLQLTVIKGVRLDIKRNAGTRNLPLTDVETIEAGTKFRVHAEAPIAGYLYVLILDAEASVTNVEFPGHTPFHVSQGDRVVVPGDVGWIIADATGPIRVVVTNQPVASGHWPKIGPGRDGMAHMPKGNQGYLDESEDIAEDAIPAGGAAAPGSIVPAAQPANTPAPPSPPHDGRHE